MSALEEDKKNLLRALITKICIDKKLPEIRFEGWFVDDHRQILDKLKDRKSDLPSVEYLEKTYKFKPFDTELTLTDIHELLNEIYTKEKFFRLIKDAKERIH